MKKFFSIYKFHLIIFLFSFLILSRFNFDADLGWHLAIGEHFLETGEIIKTDQFSWTMPGYRWGNSYFLFEILTAFLIKHFGYLATVFIFSLIASVAILVVIPRKVNLDTILISFLGAQLASINLGVRPHTISFLFFAILLRIIFSKRLSGARNFWFWFLFFLAWANFHNGFIVGLFTITFYWGVEIVWNLSQKKKVSVMGFGFNLAAGFMGTLFTPYGLSLWASILNDALFLQMHESIAEWQSIILFNYYNLFYLISGLVFIFIIYKKFEKIGPSLVFLSCLFFLFSFKSLYFTFFWALLFVFVLTRYWSFKMRFSGWIYLLAIVFGLVIFKGLCGDILKYSTLDNVFAADVYPLNAVKFMKENRILKNVFNTYEWGGYLDWSGSGIMVFIDGRMTGWQREGRSILSDYLEIKKGNCNVLSMYPVESLLVTKGSNTACFGDFKRVYEDEVAEVWVKKVISDIQSHVILADAANLK